MNLEILVSSFIIKNLSFVILYLYTVDGKFIIFSQNKLLANITKKTPFLDIS